PGRGRPRDRRLPRDRPRERVPRAAPHARPRPSRFALRLRARARMTLVASAVAFAAVFLVVVGLELAARDRRARTALALFGGNQGSVLFVNLPGAWSRAALAFVLARRDEQRLAAQLPDVVRTIARALRAGQSVDAALHEIGRALPDPAGRAFFRIREQLALGVPFEDA